MKTMIKHLAIPVLFAVTVPAGLAIAEQAANPGTVGVPPAPQAENSAPSRFGGHVHALAVNPQTKELFLGARPIYRSIDDGKSWAAIGGIPKSEERANITSIAVDPTNPQVMYAGLRQGVFKTMDGGQTWSQATDLVEDAVVTVDAGDHRRVYAVGADGVLAVSMDAGKHWTTTEGDDAEG